MPWWVAGWRLVGRPFLAPTWNNSWSPLISFSDGIQDGRLYRRSRESRDRGEFQYVTRMPRHEHKKESALIFFTEMTPPHTRTRKNGRWSSVAECPPPWNDTHSTGVFIGVSSFSFFFLRNVYCHISMCKNKEFDEKFRPHVDFCCCSNRANHRLFTYLTYEKTSPTTTKFQSISQIERIENQKWT